jgi:hypothetical protein
MLTDKTPKLRVAILIADSQGAPFSEIKAKLHPGIWSDLDLSDFDIYYTLGRKNNHFLQVFNIVIEKLRYSRFNFYQRVINLLTLTLRGIFLPKAVLEGKNQIRVDIPEGLQFLGIKILASLKLLVKLEYDLIIKTTLSSVFNPELLRKLISELDFETRIYCGPIVQNGRDQFVSGASLILNGETVKLIYQNRFRWNQWVLDDVAIGRLLRDKVEIQPVRTSNLETISEVNNLSESEIKNTLHFRCRSIEIPRNDIELLTIMVRRIRHLRHLNTEKV